MRLLIDTNILISSALFPGSAPARAFTKAVTPPHETVACNYSWMKCAESSAVAREVTIMKARSIINVNPAKRSSENRHPIALLSIASGVALTNDPTEPAALIGHGGLLSSVAGGMGFRGLP